MKAIAYNANRFKSLTQPDMLVWLELFKVIGYNVSFTDRSNIIKMPIKIHIPDFLSIPQYDPSFSKTYLQCCDERVQYILKLQEQLDIPIRLTYSGGIDSSMILTSFIQHLGIKQAEKRIQVTMCLDGIEENPSMWENVLRRSNIKLFNSELQASDWSTDRILVAGDFNDPLMGSGAYKSVVGWKGIGIFDQPWTHSLIVEYFRDKGVTDRSAEVWATVIANLLDNAPIKINTVAEWWWWIDFACKWSSVYHRILMYAYDTRSIDYSYFNKHYIQFFDGNDFQQWSMGRKEQKYGDDWLDYKHIPKRIVAKFINDPNYLNKVKRGSMWQILGCKKSVSVIDQDYNYHHDINNQDWYTSDNSFKELI